MKLTSTFLLIILSLGSLQAHATERTDIVILSNGDRVTGEIKSLEAGLLKVKTDTMGTVNIEWRFISELISDKTQSVEVTDGRRWLGQLQKPADGDHIIVNTDQGPINLSPTEVVTVWPIAATFLDKVDLDLRLGFDYSKSTDITNFNLGVDFLHRSEERLSEARLRSDITRQNEGDDQSRQELYVTQQFLRSEQKFRSWLVGLDSNDALGVDLRLYGGGTVGKYLVKTNNKWFSVSGGLLVSQENPKGADSEANLESVFTARYRFFRYATPERNFDTSLRIIPGITNFGRVRTNLHFGRVRTNLRSTFKLEFIEDLFWSMEFYATHDNKPLNEQAEKTDYGIITALGWSY
jgi:hypothetical protein